MKTIFDYDSITGMITDSKGMAICCLGMDGFASEATPAPVLELIKQGVTPDEIIKLKNNNLL